MLALVNFRGASFSDRVKHFELSVESFVLIAIIRHVRQEKTVGHFVSELRLHLHLGLIIVAR